MKRPEQSIQRSIIAYLKQVLPHGWLVIGLNNNPRSKIAGAIGKSMGCVAGLPDIQIFGQQFFDVTSPYGYTTHHIDLPTCWLIEVKAPKGTLSKEQRELHDRLTDLDFQVGVARSIDDVRALCRKWGLPTRDAELAA